MRNRAATEIQVRLLGRVAINRAHLALKAGRKVELHAAQGQVTISEALALVAQGADVWCWL